MDKRVVSPEPPTVMDNLSFSGPITTVMDTVLLRSE
jgi:hypothetical protein